MRVLLRALALAALAAAQDTLVVDISSSAAISAPIPPNFVSLSVEVDDAPRYLGPASNISSAFVALLQLLRNSGAGARGPTLRVGGDSSDYSVFLPAGAPLPARQLYAITDADLDMYAAALPRWNGRMVVGTSLFLENSTAWAAAHAAAFSAHAAGWAHVESVEVGNEPEGFNGGEALRPRAWGPRDFAREFAAHADALRAAGMPAAPPLLQGLVLGGNDSAFNAYWPAFARDFAPQLASVSRHHYALDGCGAGAAPSVGALLASDAAAFLQPFAAAAAAARVPFVVGEANSVSCGGARGVSDVFGAALWALDFLLDAAALNATQVNLHGGPRNAYSPIQTEDPPSRAPRAMPVFMGMWAASAATANGSALLSFARSGSAPADLVRAHALRDARGETRVVVVHKAPRGADAAVRVVGAPAAARAATLQRLSASAVTDARGVSFAGLTLDGVEDGVPVPGGPPDEVVAAVDGAFSFKVFAGTAAVLSFSGAAAPSAAAPSAAAPSAAAPCRDRFLWPFASTSIWNTPIGSDAEYVPAGLYAGDGPNFAPPANIHNDQDWVLRATASDPNVTWIDDSGNFPGMCNAKGKPAPITLPFPADVATDCVANNNGAGVLMPDNVTLVQMQPLYVPKAGGPIIAWYHTGAPQPFPWEMSILGDGALGAHGGSGLSSFGGAVRLGELLPGAPPIAHALKLEFWAHAYYFYNWTSRVYASCYSWPAVGCDSYFDNSGSGAQYNGTNPLLKPGALLAVPPPALPALLASLTTVPARQVAQALTDYGGYIVDDTGSQRGGAALCMEAGVSDELTRAYGPAYSVRIEDPLVKGPLYDDLLAVFRALAVVANNGQGSVGGGGVPRAPIAPPICGV
jgi:hypothetical protein